MIPETASTVTATPKAARTVLIRALISVYSTGA
jgi:hypothetical protein